MGSCNSHHTTVVKLNKSISAIRNTNTSKRPDEILEKEKDVIDPRFRDMPEWDGERYKGDGVKYMKGYKCDLQIDKLYQLREEFWAWQVKDTIIWKHLRQACLMDDVRASMVLKQLGLEPVSNCINKLKDDKGNYYLIPNFCINDPYFEKQFADENKIMNHKSLKIYITDLYENKKTELEVSVNLTGRELKSNYFSLLSDNMDKYKTRLIFGGSEIQDHHKLYQHKLKDEFQIQIMKKLVE